MEIEHQETAGAKIRQFLRELFGSRLIATLELDLLRLRQDFESRLQEKDRIIASLREEKQQLNSKIVVFENTVMPHSSRMGAEVIAYTKPTKPNFTFIDSGQPKTKWQAYQDEYYKAQAAEIAAEEAAKKSEAATAAQE